MNNKLDLATYSGTKTMLAVRENAVLVHMLHDIANYDVFQHLAAKAGQRNRGIVGWVVSLAFLKHFRNIGCFPVFWEGHCLWALVEDNSQDGGKVFCVFFSAVNFNRRYFQSKWVNLTNSFFFSPTVPGPVRDLKAWLRSSNSITLIWNLPAIEDLNGILLGFDIAYQTGNIELFIVKFKEHSTI